MRYLLTLAFTLIIFNSFAQLPIWAWGKIDTNIIPGNMQASQQVVAASGDNVLWASQQRIPGSYYGDYNLRIYDKQGKLLDSVCMAGGVHLTDIKADTAGNWYVSGFYYDSLKYDTMRRVHPPMAGEYNFVMRLNKGSLKIQWSFFIIGSGGYVATPLYTRGNSMYMSRSFFGYNTIDKVNLANGNITVLDTQRSAPVACVVADDNGNFYTSGGTRGKPVFGNYKGPSYDSLHQYIVRYKANGSYDWGIYINNTTTLNSHAFLGLLNIWRNNTIYFTSQMHTHSAPQTVNVGNVSLAPLPNSHKYIVARVDSTGFVHWVQQTKDTTAVGEAHLDYLPNAALSDSNIAVGTVVRNYVNWGNGIVDNWSKQSVAIVCYGHAGKPIWMKHTGNVSNILPQFVASNGKDIWVTGLMSDSVNMLLDSVTVPVKRNLQAPFIAKLDVHNCATPKISVVPSGAGSYVVTWDTAGSKSPYYQYVVSADPPPYALHTTTTGNSVVLNGLQPGKLHYVCLRARCANGNFSDYSCDTFTVPASVALHSKDTRISLFPNPAAETVTIKGLNKLQGAVNVRLCSITGTVVYERSIHVPITIQSIDVSRYARGVYYMEVKTATDKLVEKLVLE